MQCVLRGTQCSEEWQRAQTALEDAAAILLESRDEEAPMKMCPECQAFRYTPATLASSIGNEWVL